ncbi:MAG: 50S ribosomal protein L22 [Deltaproteobacteria bacterium]|nr:50S ribosomal protein L22 [Deltaproteobacteria bacterium]
MEVRAVSKYVKGSAQKARLVVDLIRGRHVGDALSILDFNTRAASRTVKKVLKSAVANAENTRKLDVDRLYVKKAYVDQGPSTKRMHAKAMGKGSFIHKRTSHITIVLDEKE